LRFRPGAAALPGYIQQTITEIPAAARLQRAARTPPPIDLPFSDLTVE
jgi:hypothetical protein